MQIMYQRCAGIDVHLRFLVVCLSIIEAGQQRKEIRTFRNETADLLALRAWLVQEKCTHVGMESTGVYWMPVYRRLEGFFELVVANAQHIKGVPGRKTDVQDAEWIADLLQHGLVTASFVPSQEQQDVRDLTRLRVNLVQERSRLVNRVHKTLEEAGIKLSTVLSDIMGLSGRAILDALSTRCQKCEAPTAREEMRAGSLLPGRETSRQVVLKRARFVEVVIVSGQGRYSMRFQPSQRSLQLTPNALNQLKLVVQAHRTPQAIACRAQLILLWHTHPDWSTKQVARRLNRHESWVRKWRRRSRRDSFTQRCSPIRGATSIFPGGTSTSDGTGV